jgi:hypothetical protein
VVSNRLDFPYVAFVTYGDNTTATFNLPVVNVQTPLGLTAFWGITSEKQIRSIHFGGQNGAAVRNGGFAISDLTVAATASDVDADGIPDSVDNCINVPNGPLIPDSGGNSQFDADGDGYGNLCDADLNNSGFVTAHDYQIFRGKLNTTNQVADLNGSGYVTAHDYFIFRASLNKPPGPSALHP